MVSTSIQPVGLQSSAAPSPGPFILTLCRLDAPVTIRQPQAPALRDFTFFMGRGRRADGSVSLFLHMGYFPTLEDAQMWAHRMRAKYPQACAMPVPPALVPQTAPAAATPPTLAAASADAMSDTQVFRILETRQAGKDGDAVARPERPEISMLRPDSTMVRRALKEAVVQGAPVSFAVQLRTSTLPIDPGIVPALDIFRAYTLYMTEGLVNGQPRHSLRLGFFDDAISAKQVGYYVRTSFESLAVVPIDEQERANANEHRVEMSQLADPAQSRIDEVLASGQQRKLQEGTAPHRVLSMPGATTAATGSQPKATPKKRDANSLEQTLELLAASEVWNDPDSLSETGVRHLKVDFQKRKF